MAQHCYRLGDPPPVEFMERLGAALRGAGTYGCVEDLIEDALRNGPDRAFVAFCLACRQRRQSRKDLNDVRRAWDERNKC